MKIRRKFTRSVKSLLSQSLLSSISLEQLEAPLKGVYYSYPTLTETGSSHEAPNMNFLPDAEAMRFDTYTTPDIFTLDLHNVVFCPEYHILHTKSRQIIEESISTQKDLVQFDIRVFFQKKLATIPEVCSVFRSHKNGYYHTLIDNLPRLYLLHHPRFQKLDEIKIICPSEPTRVEQFYLEKLLPNNARITIVDPSKQYLLENLIFPSFLSRRFSGYLPSEYRNWFIERVGPKRPRQKTNRIFISRIATHKGRQRCLLNEEQLFASLQPYGFNRYILEQLTIEEQISLFYDAEIVVAAHGAGLTNTIFSGQIKVLELFPTPFVLPHYYFLAQSLGHRYGYWCAQEKSIYDNFSVNIPEILKILDGLK
ncbi:MAG: glycosyltransferase family 61 protein [Cyanobacteria bacterium P01_F01_bin.86]